MSDTEIFLTIKGSSRLIFSVTVLSSCSVLQLKHKIAGLKSIPASAIKLINNGRFLSDTWTLRDLGLSSGDSVVMAVPKEKTGEERGRDGESNLPLPEVTVFQPRKPEQSSEGNRNSAPVASAPVSSLELKVGPGLQPGSAVQPMNHPMQVVQPQAAGPLAVPGVDLTALGFSSDPTIADFQMQLYRSPLYQNMMQEVVTNPQTMKSFAMLNPFFANNPEFAEAMFSSPEMVKLMQASVAYTTAELMKPQPFEGAQSSPNPLNPSRSIDDPAQLIEEMKYYAHQMVTLREMGFTDDIAMVTALSNSNGDVEEAARFLMINRTSANYQN